MGCYILCFKCSCLYMDRRWDGTILIAGDWQNNCAAMFSAVVSSLVGFLWYFLNSSGDIRFVPLGREICLIECMFCDISLSDSVGFKCGSSVVVLHSSSNSVLLRWKSVSMFLR